ncbi:hypothetical protein CYLTODRAFT_412229 [Cylindrobasidium torrendii FP15055 ss-10]|uniref:Uncharacterized protein n=1 Tax=Cylindrobasidium torrendii FP15055 ss-10 TaxID=1314674 RepID=A0A0D7B6U4_9AGAR|nr:hypothetical protein CYLTODRAFT_412229 [Cylindrobasidium torrendii FP15055 ss-10]
MIAALIVLWTTITAVLPPMSLPTVFPLPEPTFNIGPLPATPTFFKLIIPHASISPFIVALLLIAGWTTGVALVMARTFPLANCAHKFFVHLTGKALLATMGLFVNAVPVCAAMTAPPEFMPRVLTLDVSDVIDESDDSDYEEEFEIAADDADPFWRKGAHYYCTMGYRYGATLEVIKEVSAHQLRSVDRTARPKTQREVISDFFKCTLDPNVAHESRYLYLPYADHDFQRPTMRVRARPLFDIIWITRPHSSYFTREYSMTEKGWAAVRPVDAYTGGQTLLCKQSETDSQHLVKLARASHLDLRARTTRRRRITGRRDAPAPVLARLGAPAQDACLPSADVLLSSASYGVELTTNLC